MEHYLLPLLTVDEDNPDFDRTDTTNEIQQLHERNSAIQAVVDGKLPPDELLDLLEFQGLDPVYYVSVAIDNLDRAIREGVAFEAFDECTLIY